jgi:hypothetical protein
MIVLIDSRELRNVHITAALADMGIRFKPKKLEYGDYSFEMDGKSYEKNVAIERKASLTEIAGNFCTGRQRFETEFRRAQADGCQVHLVIEQEDGWKRILRRMVEDVLERNGVAYKAKDTWRSQFCANSMLGSLSSWKEKYNLRIEFVKKECFAEYMIGVFNQYLEEE